jgi:predicted amidophosphoribosyltransferase
VMGNSDSTRLTLVCPKCQLRWLVGTYYTCPRCGIPLVKGG